MVLPLSFSIDVEAQDRPQFEALSRAKVLLYFAKRLFVVPTNELQDDFVTVALDRTKASWIREPKVETGVDAWECFKNWEVKDVDEMIDCLEQLYWGNTNSVRPKTAWYGQLLAQMKTIQITEGTQCEHSSQ